MEDYDKIKKTLAVAFMHDLDVNRPEGKMCLSNGECADIEKAFNDQDWSKLARYLDKYTESEDERHRKWILEYLYDGLRKADEQFKGHFKSAIDWLEKQKEESHDGKKWIYEDDYHKDMERCFNDGKDEVLENPEKYGLQKEQKPAEKQDYSGLNDSERAIHRGFLAAGVENVPVGIIKETTKECIAHFPWPTKWSEEDEKIRKLLIWQVHRNIEDETNDLAQSVYDGIKGHDPDLEESIEDWKKCLAWLKSLRPSWKPSEEDKKILHAIELYVGQLGNNETINGFSNSDMLRVLKSIYE